MRIETELLLETALVKRKEIKLEWEHLTRNHTKICHKNISVYGKVSAELNVRVLTLCQNGM